MAAKKPAKKAPARKKAAAKKKPARKRKPQKRAPSKTRTANLRTMTVTDHHGKVTTQKAAAEHDALGAHAKDIYGAKPIRYVNEPRAGGGNRWLVHFDPDGPGTLTCRVKVHQ